MKFEFEHVIFGRGYKAAFDGREYYCPSDVPEVQRGFWHTGYRLALVHKAAIEKTEAEAAVKWR